MAHVIPFPGKTVAPWFYLTDHSLQENLLDFTKGYPVCPVFSEEDLLSTFSCTQPASIFIQADLTWADPIQLISRLSQFSRSPILLLLKKQKSKKQELFIRQAYQAGIFDILYLPLNNTEFEETIDLIRKISQKATIG